MEKVEFEPGLIRYASENNITKGENFKFTTRIMAYSVVLLLLLIALTALIFVRSDLEATALRIPGQMFSTRGDTIQNVYTVKIVNKTSRNFNNLKIDLVSNTGKINVLGGAINVPANGLSEQTLFINIHKKDLMKSKEDIEIGIYQEGKLVETTNTSFPSPVRFD
jgi:polyferredoxin